MSKINEETAVKTDLKTIGMIKNILKNKMKYLIIFLILAIIYISLTGCTKSERDKYRLNGFFTVKVKNEN
jgi:hypothetical protein